MRTPVDRVEQHDTPPAPAVSLLPGRKLTEPDDQFIRDIATAIRAGARPLTAAQWLGVSRKQWRTWKQRTGEPYDTLRAQVRTALAHLETKLQADLAKRSPGAALRGLRRIRDEEPDDAPREYHQSGVHGLRKQLPHMLTRISADTLAPDDLSPLEATARQWRESVITDLGGHDVLTTTKLALINAALGSWLLLSTVDSYLMELASTTGVVNRKHRAAFAIVEQRARLADSFVRQLQALGLEKQNTLPDGISIGHTVVIIPDNGRDPLLAVGGATNRQHPAHRPPEDESSAEPTAVVELPPRDGGDDFSSTDDQPRDGDASDGLEHDLGLI
jgi:hypothetical protein